MSPTADGSGSTPDVWDVIKHHGQALQAKPERPRSVAGIAIVVEDALLRDAAAEDLKPVALKEDLELEGRLREWEVCVHPPALHVTEQVPRKTLQGALELLHCQVNTCMSLRGI